MKASRLTGSSITGIPTTGSRWTELTRPAQGSAPLGAPGLWRALDDQLVFDLPPRGLGFDAEAWLDWAAATGEGQVPDGWRAPSLEDLKVEPAQLLARAGSHLAQAEVRRTDTRLALRHSGLLPAESRPDPVRQAWLEELVADAARQWRLVRVGLIFDRPVLEIDLSGAPLKDLPALVPLGLDALRLVTEWLLPSLHLVLDPNVASAALLRPPTRPRAETRNCP